MRGQACAITAALVLAGGAVNAAAQPEALAPAPSVPRVLAIYSDTRVLPAVDALDPALREGLGTSEGRVNYFSEFLDAARFPGDELESAFVAYLQRRYRDQAPDVVLAAGPPALDLLIEHRGTLFPGVPIVFFAIPESRLARDRLDARIVGVADIEDEASTLALAFALQPDAERLVVVAGNSPRDEQLLGNLRRAFDARPSKVPVTWLAGLTMEGFKSALAALPKRTVVYYASVFVDAAGRSFSPADALAQLSPASAAPLYGRFESYIGQGIVGGAMQTWAGTGRRAAEMTRRVLAGEDPQAVAPERSTAIATIVDWRQIRRFGLDPARLPAGTTIRFREPTFWEQYWQAAIGASVIGALQLALIAVLAIALQRRRQADATRRLAEARAAELRDELAHASRVATLGELASTLAHELNQPLAAILSNAQAARRWLMRPDPDLDELRAVFDDIVTDDKRAGEIIHRMRHLLRRGQSERTRFDLRTVVHDVSAMVHGECLASNVRVSLDLSSAPLMVEADEVQAQQVLLNLMKNAVDAMGHESRRPRHLYVSARADGPAAVISVRDTGPGLRAETRDRLFDPFFTTKAKGLGIGLAVCRRIAETHGGSLEAGPPSTDGATFRFSLPLEAARP